MNKTLVEETATRFSFPAETSEPELESRAMKNKQTERKSRSGFGLTRHLIGGVLCLAVISLICSSASAQNLFVSDGYSGIEHNLGHIYKIPPNGVRSTFASGLNGPSGLAFDRVGNLFVGLGGQILKFTPAGVRTTFASGLNGPEGLAFDGAGNLAVADNGSGNIYKFSPAGARTTFASGLNGPEGLAFDGVGNLFVADLSSGNIYKFTPCGVESIFASGLNYPYDLAFDSTGDLFVTEAGSGSGGHVYKFTVAGVRSTFAVLGAPEGLAFDSAGNLFVVDGDTEKIFEFTPTECEAPLQKSSVLALIWWPIWLSGQQPLRLRLCLSAQTGSQTGLR